MKKLMSFFTEIAEKCGYDLLYSWEDFGCNHYHKSEEDNSILLIFDGKYSLPDIKTPIGTFCFGSYVYPKTVITNSLLEAILEKVNGAEVVKEYSVPDDGPGGFKYQLSSWGPVVRIPLQSNQKPASNEKV